MIYLLASLLGTVQGLTEFLPVSSTAHLLIGERLLGHEDPGGVFTVMIQLGSILALTWLYRTKIASVIAGLSSSPEARRFAVMLLIAFLPAIPIGLFLGDFVQEELYQNLGAIGAAFIAGGVVMLIVERVRPSPTVTDASHTPFARAFGVGLCQALALVPGVSRSGATIVGGMMLGLDRPAAAEFSFFLAMPTMVAAFVYSLMDLRSQVTSERLAEISVGFVFAFLAALVVVKPFLRFVGRSGFAPFAWYRIAAGLAIVGAVAAGWL